MEKAVLEASDIKKKSKVEERGKSGEKCTFVFDWFKLFCWVMCWQIVVMTPGLCSESFTVSVLWSKTRDSESNFWNRLDPVWFSHTRTVAVSLGYCLMDKMKSFRGGVYSRSLKPAYWSSASPNWPRWVDAGWVLPPKCFSFSCWS